MIRAERGETEPQTKMKCQGKRQCLKERNGGPAFLHLDSNREATKPEMRGGRDRTHRRRGWLRERKRGRLGTCFHKKDGGS